MALIPPNHLLRNAGYSPSHPASEASVIRTKPGHNETANKKGERDVQGEEFNSTSPQYTKQATTTSPC